MLLSRLLDLNFVPAFRYRLHNVHKQNILMNHLCSRILGWGTSWMLYTVCSAKQTQKRTGESFPPIERTAKSFNPRGSSRHSGNPPQKLSKFIFKLFSSLLLRQTERTNKHKNISSRFRSTRNHKWVIILCCCRCNKSRDSHHERLGVAKLSFWNGRRSRCHLFHPRPPLTR